MSNLKKRKRDIDDKLNDKANGRKAKVPKLANPSTILPSTQPGATDFEKDDCVYRSSKRSRPLCKSTPSKKILPEGVSDKKYAQKTANVANDTIKRIKKERKGNNMNEYPQEISTKQPKVENQKNNVRKNGKKNNLKSKQEGKLHGKSPTIKHTSAKVICDQKSIKKLVHKSNEGSPSDCSSGLKKGNRKVPKRVQTSGNDKEVKENPPRPKQVRVKKEPKCNEGDLPNNRKNLSKNSKRLSAIKREPEDKKEKKSKSKENISRSKGTKVKKEPSSDQKGKGNDEVQPQSNASGEQSFTQDNIMEMLRCLEGSKPTSAKSKHKTTTETRKVPKLNVIDASDMEEMDTSDTESESDWEEVKGENQEEKSQLPDGPVEITLDGPLLMNRKRRKKGFDMEAWFQRQVNRHQREAQVLMHKVHLLCLLCHGLHLNQICNSHLVLSVALSLLPSESLRTKLENYTMNVLSRLVKWYVALFKIDAETQESTAAMEETLLKRLGTRKLASEKEMVLIFIIMLRALGVDSRLVYSMQPISHKPNLKSIKGVSRQKATEIEVIDIDNDNKKTEGINKMTDKKGFATPPQTPSSSKLEVKVKRERSHKKKDVESKVKRSKQREHSSDSEDEKRKKSKGKRPVKSKYLDAKKKRSKGNTDEDIQEISSGSEFEGEKSFRISPSYKNKSKSAKGKKTKIVSSDSEEDIEITKAKVKSQGTDFWVEVFLETEQKWICVDCIKAKVNCHGEMESRATKPISYILAYDNNNCVKDVTQRYANNWVSHTRKNRVEEEWWEETLDPYDTKDGNKKEKEDMQLQAQMMKRPLPTSIAEFKNHPLYALKRHLLKFEAIYPDTSIPVGYIRGEPVYARDCVHTLRSRETWLREARCVRLGETPYKLVKARKKMRGPAPSTDEPTLEVFGIWQTEDYIPPPAVDGKVPRNEYGNVEVYKECMIPGGTVHLKVPALNKVAKKLNIDIAPAMTGWDQHGGFPHPILDGWIVCEEHKDILLAAWDEEQEIQKEKDAEKRDKRVYGNWKTLIKGLLIKERIKKRYNLDEKLTPKKKAQGKEEAAKDVAMSWPQNKQTKKTNAKKKSKKNDEFIVPVEEL